MREIVVFIDQPADTAVAEAVAYLEERGLQTTHRTPYSVSFAALAGAVPSARGAEEGIGDEQAERDDAGELPAGTGQCAAVPIQLKPEWCRMWVTVNDTNDVSEAAEAYVERHREKSREIEAAVRTLEADIYSEARWPAYELTLRASLKRAGSDPTLVDGKVAAFKQRWLGLGRKAAKAPPEDHRSA